MLLQKILRIFFSLRLACMLLMVYAFFLSVPTEAFAAMVPNAPLAIFATEGDAQASVSYIAPVFDGGSPIIQYTVTAYPFSGGMIQATTTGDALSLVMTGLTNGESYTFVVTATNDVGESDPSPESAVLTLLSVPNPPEGLQGTVAGQSISLVWSVPPENGLPVTDYHIEYKPHTGDSWTSFADDISIQAFGTLTGLTNDVAYDVRVRAGNTRGFGDPSNTITITPGEPAEVSIRSFPDVVVPDGTASVRIANTGAVAYTYAYAWCITDAIDNLCGGGDDSFFASSSVLVSAGAYTDLLLPMLHLSAGTLWFHSTISYGSTLVTTAQSFVALLAQAVPDAPTGALAIAGDARATVSFTPPFFDGGSTILFYRVTASSGGRTNTGTSSPIVVTGLTNGTEYTFSVTAINAIGESSASLASSAVVPLAEVVTDTTPPLRSALTPSGSVYSSDGSVTLSLTTDEDAVCRYTTLSGQPFTSIILFDTTGGRVHQARFTDFLYDTPYTYNVLCADIHNNTNAEDLSTTFSLTHTEPVVIAVVPEENGGASRGGGGGGGGSKKVSTTGDVQNILSHLPCASIDPSLASLLVLLTNTGILPQEKLFSACEVFVRKSGISFSNTPASSFRFRTPLSLGMVHPDVRLLQQFLNTHGFLIAETGSGSLGNETEVFGKRTEDALKRFQQQYAEDVLTPFGLFYPTGYFGARTMQKVNELF